MVNWGVVYESPGVHRRSGAERRDQVLSWQRSDSAFFAAGACHILAFEFLRRPDTQRFEAVGLQRPGASFFDHVYVSDGLWAFDYYGWTPESELITEILKFETASDPCLSLERIVIDGDFEALCTKYRHRRPSDFAADPRPRARQYLASILGS